ncbi:MAG: peptidase [Bacteroidetes bacterium]|nr:peptidase [Bacteroidota bacterium]
MNVSVKLILFFLLANFFLAAQNGLPIPRNVQPAFDKGTRSPSGQPGKNYWQNFAAYDLNINFTPATRLVSGTVDIVYTNNSPDTLRKIHFKLYPNIYQKGAPRMTPFHPKDIGEGMSIEKITVNGEVQDAGRARAQGTEMDLPIQPLAPKSQARFSIDFSYKLNEGSHQRTGEIEAGAYFIAYFFPRIAVYDDVDGWNTNPYLGTQEFYNDFCDFKADITVPKGYVVWATGDLKNGNEVLSPVIYQRLTRAANRDDFVNIIDSTDLQMGNVTAPYPTNTFRFEAKDVTDFVFATSNHYLWQSTSLVVDKSTGRRTRVDAVFNPKHQDYFRVLGDARKTVEYMSFRFPKWPFPYPHETVFDGLDQMEYPMMVNDNPVEDVAESIELTDHEIFHTMFPFYMGINETKYGWMDEGWATIGEWLISTMIDSTIVDEYGVERYEKSAGSELDLPIVTLSTQQSGMPFFTNSYPKPAMGYLFIKDMLGDELFTKALHHYIETWHGKHPLPNDFFNCMNAGAGRDMNWFWKAWFFENGVPDLAIGKVSSKQITIENKGGKPVPIDLSVQFSDGTTTAIHRSIAVWEKGDKSVNIPLPIKKEVVKITLGSTYTPDVDKLDNLWEKGKN